MNKKELREDLGFEEDKDYFEFFKLSTDKTPGGSARVEFTKDGKRMSKLYWDEIRLVYGTFVAEKPFLKIKTLNGFKVSIWKNEFWIWPYNKMGDTCYFSGIPNFDIIDFYMEFDWAINLGELRTR